MKHLTCGIHSTDFMIQLRDFRPVVIVGFRNYIKSVIGILAKSHIGATLVYS